MTETEREKLNRVNEITIVADVFIDRTDVEIEVQSNCIDVEVHNVEGEAAISLCPNTLDQLSDEELRWVIKTCRELHAGRQ